MRTLAMRTSTAHRTTRTTTLTVQAVPTTTVASSTNPSVFGQSVTFTATVTAATVTFDNGGTVQFAVDGNAFGEPVSLSGGSATIADATLSMGTHTITASYSGDTNFSTRSGTLSGGQAVVRASTATSLNTSASPITFGNPVTFTATVGVLGLGQGTPTGTVHRRTACCWAPPC